MELTNEQISIIQSIGDIKINAVAGSGKTTTLIEYARTRPKNDRILYLAFNKTVKLEAARKFAKHQLHQVTVETAHSLAYKHVVTRSPYQIKPNGYKIHEIAQLLGIPNSGEKHLEYVIANHVSRFMAYFCNSDKRKVQELNYLDTITDEEALGFVNSHYDLIEQQTRILLAKMDKAEVDITHDFYLKKFQLSQPQLPYNFILFDEGQDASMAMLDVFLKQKATKVIVGDTHQQIYGWRYAINSLERTDFPSFSLSNSFRFNQAIAQLAFDVIRSKKKFLRTDENFSITGKGEPVGYQSKAIIARTNLGLLVKAIQYITEHPRSKGIYFEGNIQSYTYAENGSSIYDVLNLFNGNRKKIRDPLIKQMKDMLELAEYVKKSNDAQLGMMIEVVNTYGKDIPTILEKLKSKHLDDENKEKAEVIFSTVHRCKGMEYHCVELADDFITPEQIDFQLENDGKPKNLAKLVEEINLLYVAVTRTRHTLFIPEKIVPNESKLFDPFHPDSEQIILLETKDIEAIKEQTKQKAYAVDQVREVHKKAYQPWTPSLDEELTTFYCEGHSLEQMAAHFNRTKGAIISRIKKLELAELYG